MKQLERIAIVLAVTFVITVLAIGCQHRGSVSPGTETPNAGTGLPELSDKPQPVGETFRGCPPEGHGSDPALNRLKNRVDDGTYRAVDFDAVERLSWPHTVERRIRSEWSSGDASTIGRYEGLPLAVEGYLAGAKEEGPEATNCNAADKEMRDFHVWLTRSRGEDRSGSIVVEVTPRLRARHPAWQLKTLEQIAKDGMHVRISGWLMFDPDHPEQLGKTRGTLWEIHPIMRIDVESLGQWTTLDR